MLPALATALILAAAAAQDFPIRTSDPAIRAAVGHAITRSPTMGRLIGQLEERRAIVYVKWSPALPPLVRGAVMPRVTDAGRVRYLWVALKPDMVCDALVALIGHEIQHVLEILNAGLSDSAAIGAMYQHRDGGSGKHIFDTAEARAVGLQVERELKMNKNQW